MTFPAVARRRNSDASHALRVRDVGTFALENVPRATVLPAPPMPLVLPVLFHGGRREEPLGRAPVALPLYTMFSRRSGALRFGSHEALCAVGATGTIPYAVRAALRTDLLSHWCDDAGAAIYAVICHHGEPGGWQGGVWSGWMLRKILDRLSIPKIWMTAGVSEALAGVASANWRWRGERRICKRRVRRYFTGASGERRLWHLQRVNMARRPSSSRTRCRRG